MARKMTRISEPIETTELCYYGCGQIAKFKNGSNRLMCSFRHSSCPENKKKNSAGLSKAHKEGRVPTNFGDKQGWSKGLSKDTDERVRRHADAIRGVSRPGHAWSDESKLKASISRTKVILAGEYDSSGRKGHRGHYDGIYFHSSWELAYYVWISETTDINIQRNATTFFEYEFDGTVRRYVPDFVIGTDYVEIKSYLHGPRDQAKYEQTKNLARYIFDVSDAVTYCREQYGNKFWEKLYMAD